MVVLLTAILGLLGPAAPAKDAPATQPAAQPAANTMGDMDTVHRGAKFTLADSITMDEVAKAPEKFAGKTVRVDGMVKTVCRKKGCWMVLAGADPKATARITFKDYGFFAPLNSADHPCSVEGTVTVKTLGEKERAHLAQDAGKKVEDIPVHELRLVATGIEIRPKK